MRSFLVVSVCLGTVFCAEAPRQFTPQQKRWWAFQKIVKPPAPPAGNPVDALVRAKLAEKGLQPNPPADKFTLLRRVTLDLTGLPPTPEHVQAFVADTSREAWERVVDRLLASPRYGERWARHWLDLARYADSEGFKADETRPNIWRYRDYVIDAFNSDKPYDRFMKEQIAGDELYPGDAAALTATGFNRHFPDESNARNLMQRRQELLDDITDTVGATFLGMTVGCARCHDHKFDPILHKDYYRLQAFFANTRIEDQAGLLTGEARKEYEERLAAWSAQTKAIREEMEKLAAAPLARMYADGFDKFPPEIQDAITTAGEKRTPIQWQMYQKARPQIEHSVEEAGKRLKGAEAKRWAELAAELKGFDAIKPGPMPVAQAMIDNGAESPKTWVLQTGVYDARREEVQPGFLSILDPGQAKITPVEGRSSGRRSALANWLADPGNPLPARVMANRIWHYHFGQGIAGTPSDFGVMGERPANLPLLDYLAASLVENGWSVKKLHRVILLSETYRQTAAVNAAAMKVDEGNRLFWRYPRHRLDGESIRDSILQVSGLLNQKMGGPGVFPPMPPGMSTRGGWKQNEDPSETLRRSVYVFVRRNTRYPMFEVFDMPDTHESCARRNKTVTAPQALELLNNELVLTWAGALAGRVSNDGGMNAAEMVERAWRMTYARAPGEAEKRRAVEFLEKQAAVAGDGKAALVDLCHMLLNSNEFVYVN